MKTIITFFTIATFVCCSYARAQKPTGTKTKSDKPQQQETKYRNVNNEAKLKKVSDVLIMRSGTMMLFKDGRVTPMETEMTLKNGTIVKPDGTVKLKDGSTKIMQSGDRIDLEGHLTQMGNPAAEPPQPQNKNK
jgi:hypothetical protein